MQTKLKFGDPKSIEARNAIEREAFLDELIEKSNYDLCLDSDRLDAEKLHEEEMSSRDEIIRDVFLALERASEDPELEPEYLPDFLEISRLLCLDNSYRAKQNPNFLLFEKYLD